MNYSPMSECPVGEITEKSKKHPEDVRQMSVCLNCQKCEHCAKMPEDGSALVTLHQQQVMCHQCDEKLQDEYSLSQHIKTKHWVQIMCQLCDETFKSEENLMNHIDMDHPKSVLERTFLNPSAVK